jgi:hypothetical protein
VKFSNFLGLCKLTAQSHPLFPWSLIDYLCKADSGNYAITIIGMNPTESNDQRFPWANARPSIKSDPVPVGLLIQNKFGEKFPFSLQFKGYRFCGKLHEKATKNKQTAGSVFRNL